MHTLQSKRRRRVWRDDHLYTRGSKRESEGGYWRWGVSHSCVEVASTAFPLEAILLLFSLASYHCHYFYTYDYDTYRSSAVPFSIYYFANFVYISFIILHFSLPLFSLGTSARLKATSKTSLHFFHSLDLVRRGGLHPPQVNLDSDYFIYNLRRNICDDCDSNQHQSEYYQNLCWIWHHMSHNTWYLHEVKFDCWRYTGN